MFRGGGGFLTFETPTTPHWKIFCQTLPYLWPKPWLLRFQVVMSLLCLIASNLSTLALPISLKMAVDKLTQTPPEFPLQAIVAYGALRFGGSFFSQLRDIFYAKLSTFTEKTIALQTFTHLQSLSLRWHLQRKTGSVLRSVSRGASSFSSLLRIVLFQIAPIFVQVIVVCVYLFLKYSWYFGLITFSVIACYFLFTFTTTEWRNKYRRVMNNADNEYNQKATDALLNFETVKYFNAEHHEERRMESALTAYADANQKSQQSLAVLNAGQNLVITAGVVGAMFLAGHQVTNGDMSVGDWVLVQAFILQLYDPLGFLGTYYQMIKQSIVDVESMFKLLEAEIDVLDKPDAFEMEVNKGEVVFENVCFSYTEDLPILKNVSFTVKPNQKIAIVGPSGAGKSTIARLLYRFFDIQSGRILIDGQDISRATQFSLRQAIGIVPQDTVLFNDTIAYNIGYGIYGRVADGATREQLESAAKSAAIHDFIMTQKEKYETMVGERGLRLSGGEKQRVSIARAILKAPRIMVFDEATSSLDTHTEKSIMSALNVVAQGRSSITVAHRLSTIMTSDQILVLKAGEIVERGTHDDLLAANGEYKRMWDKQQEKALLEESLAQIKQMEILERKVSTGEIKEKKGDDVVIAIGQGQGDGGHGHGGHGHGGHGHGGGSGSGSHGHGSFGHGHGSSDSVRTPLLKGKPGDSSVN